MALFPHLETTTDVHSKTDFYPLGKITAGKLYRYNPPVLAVIGFEVLTVEDDPHSAVVYQALGHILGTSTSFNTRLAGQEIAAVQLLPD